MEAATNATTNSETTETLASAVASINEDNEEGVSGYNHSLHHFIQDEQDGRSNSQIGGSTVDQQDEEGRIMVNLEAIEVVSNLDEVSLVQGNFLSFGIDVVIWIPFSLCFVPLSSCIIEGHKASIESGL